MNAKRESWTQTGSESTFANSVVIKKILLEKTITEVEDNTRGEIAVNGAYLSQVGKVDLRMLSGKTRC